MPAIARLHFDRTLLAIDAAKRGQGIVPGNAIWVREELARGELIEPFTQRLPLNKGYYLVHPKRQPLGRAANISKEWLLDRFSASETAARP